MLRTLSVVLLASSPLAAQSLVRTFSGPTPSPNFGLVASTVGDVDGDGLSDLLVGEPDDSTNGTRSGAVRIVSGATGAIIHRVFGTAANEGLGSAVGGVGDANGDGVPDFAVTVPGRRPNSQSGVIEIRSGLDASLLHQVAYPSSIVPRVPQSVAAAGDVNGDGFADVLTGETTSVNSAGSAAVVSGRDGSLVYETQSFSALSRLSSSLAPAGDVNDDGFDDFVIGSTGPFGEIRVVSGFDGTSIWATSSTQVGGRIGESAANTGDLNGDGVDDLAVGYSNFFFGPNGTATLSGATGQVLWSTSIFGTTAGAGDVNGDGIPDVLVGDPNVPGGIVTLLSGINGSVLRTVTPPPGATQFGNTVGTLGDLNNDGLPEVWVQGRDANGDGTIFVYDGGFTATPGRVGRRGAACLGSDNRLPAIDVLKAPRIGQPLQFRLRSATPQRVVALHFGFALNIDLSPFGAPGCSSLASPLVAFVGQTDLTGRSDRTLQVPNDPALIGGRFAVQWTIVDPGANALTIVESAALDLTIGG